jgi:hypothetical protein
MTVLHELSHASPVLKTVDVASAYAGEEFFPFLGGFAESAANADTIAFVVGALLGQPTATERVSADRATREQRAGKLTGDDARFASLTAGLARVIALYARDVIETAIVPYLKEVLQQKQWAVRHRGRGLSQHHHGHDQPAEPHEAVPAAPAHHLAGCHVLAGARRLRRHPRRGRAEAR